MKVFAGDVDIHLSYLISLYKESFCKLSYSGIILFLRVCCRQECICKSLVCFKQIDYKLFQVDVFVINKFSFGRIGKYTSQQIKHRSVEWAEIFFPSFFHKESFKSIVSKVGINKLYGFFKLLCIIFDDGFFCLPLSI